MVKVFFGLRAEEKDNVLERDILCPEESKRQTTSKGKGCYRVEGNKRYLH
jgi:hypothetical protein